MFDTYEVRARLVPALICSVPFLAFGYFFLAKINTDFTQIVIAQALGGISMMAAVFLLLAFASRYVGTWLQDRMFDDGDRFPTTIIMTDQDTTFSASRKQRIRDKIQRDFDIDLAGHTENTAESRKQIGEAVGMIRRNYFGKKGLVLQRNIEFGIAKNIAGGSILALALSIIIVSVGLASGISDVLFLGIMMTLVYTVLICFGLMAMVANAKRYATVLFEDYLAN